MEYDSLLRHPRVGLAAASTQTAGGCCYFTAEGQ